MLQVTQEALQFEDGVWSDILSSYELYFIKKSALRGRNGPKKGPKSHTKKTLCRAQVQATLIVYKREIYKTIYDCLKFFFVY
jgi:hypothetical protein